MDIAWKQLRLAMITVAFLSIAALATTPAIAQGRRRATFVNPLNLPYRFQLDAPSRREAADPTLVRFKGSYWLFASRSGGYWKSDDLLHWNFIEPAGLPIEEYAPAVVAIGDKLYFTAFNVKAVYGTADPESGKWTRFAEWERGYADPDFFYDDDGRLYLYEGCSANGPINVTELNPATFQPFTSPRACLQPDFDHRGWEVAGDDNRGRKPNAVEKADLLPWIEGAWMNKIGGRYYLQYSGPGTEYKTYADGVFVSDHATGPFNYAPYSPFSFKPTGFITGPGHSSTVQYSAGNYWHVTTLSISKRHMFERRLGLFPTAVVADGQLVTNTYLGDYPQYAPGVAKNPAQDNSPGWMLLSYDKPARASSTLAPSGGERFEIANAFDEDIRTWWSAATANPGEWLEVDLGKLARIDSVQINFADQGSTAMGRLTGDGYRYYVEISSDGKSWKTIIDRRQQGYDLPHDYIQLDVPVKARYARLTNVHSPAGALFSISGLRMFGSGLSSPPRHVTGISVERDQADERRAHITWKATPNADFYIVRYGIAPDRLFGNYQVYKATTLDINSLNSGQTYYYAVDAVNDSGVTKGSKVVRDR